MQNTSIKRNISRSDGWRLLWKGWEIIFILSKIFCGFIQLWLRGWFLVLAKLRKWFSVSLDTIITIIQVLFLLFYSNLYQASFVLGNTDQIHSLLACFCHFVIWPFEPSINNAKQVGSYLFISQMNLAANDSIVLYCNFLLVHILYPIRVFCPFLWGIGLPSAPLYFQSRLKKMPVFSVWFSEGSFCNFCYYYYYYYLLINRGINEVLQ